MNEVYNLIDSGAGRDAIVFVLDEICLAFPEGEARDGCDEFMSREYDHLLQWAEG